MSANVKLIVCDVDGTLLKSGESRIGSDVFGMIEEVKRKGMLFALASGRSKNGLTKLFPDTKDIILISSDGTYATLNGEVIYQKPIEPSSLNKILPLLSNSDFVLYSNDVSFASTEYIADFIYEAERKKVLPLEKMKRTDLIYKTAIFKKRNFPHYAEHYIKNNRLLKLCYDKPDLAEFISPGADKGEALSAICEKFHIKYEETAAFGDNLNDISMLKEAYHSYAVGACRPEVKSLARFYAENAAAEIVKKFL